MEVIELVTYVVGCWLRWKQRVSMDMMLTEEWIREGEEVLYSKSVNW